MSCVKHTELNSAQGTFAYYKKYHPDLGQGQGEFFAIDGRGCGQDPDDIWYHLNI